MQEVPKGQDVHLSLRTILQITEAPKKRQVVARIGGWSLTYNQERGLQLTYTCNSPLVWKARELESNSSLAWEARTIYIAIIYYYYYLLLRTYIIIDDEGVVSRKQV